MRPFQKYVAIIIFCALGSSPVSAQTGLAAQLEGLRQADMRLATTLYRLSVANDRLCRNHARITGIALHGRDEYDEAVRTAADRHFGFESAIGVEGTVPGSPAAQAGVQADDSLMAIDGVPIGDGESRGQALDAIDDAGARGPITLDLRRGDQNRRVIIQPIEACRVRAEIDVSDDLNAETDGAIIQVDSALINLVEGDDGALAAIVAHELGHVVLDHPARLTAAHVNRGFFKGFGRSARLFKQTENEADRLSVTLMANAGYDPQAAVRYWLTYGPRLNDHGGLGSTHLPWRDRARLIGEEAARVARDPARPIVPEWINSRDQPLK